MFTYQYTASGDVLRSDGIGMDAQNPEVLEWIALGNTIAAYIAPIQTLADAQSLQVIALQNSYQSAINSSVSFKNATGVTSSYPSGNSISLNGATSIQNLNNVIVSGSSAWTLGKWLDVNNIAQTFTFADLQGLAAAMEAQEVMAWQNLEMKVAQVEQATTIAQVQAITF